MQIYAEMSKNDIIEAVNAFLSKNITLNPDEQFIYDESSFTPFRVEIGSKVTTHEEAPEESEATAEELEETPFDTSPAPEEHKKKNLFGGLANLK